MANPFVHVELVTNDMAEAKKFYTALFDWKLEDIPGMDYTVIKVGEGTGGGMMKNPMPDSPSFWLAYVLVADAVAATAKARSLGATICKEVTEIPGIGWFSVISGVETAKAANLAAFRIKYGVSGIMNGAGQINNLPVALSCCPFSGIRN